MSKLTNKRIEIRKGWDEAGRQGIALGEPVFVGQDWIPVKWDDEEDPTFHKRAGLILAPDKPIDVWANVRKMFGDGKIESLMGQAVRNLLIDADALLKVKNATQEYFRGNLNGTIRNALKVKETLAALPENLK